MGRVSQAQAEENRRRVVETASRLFREQGTHASVADIMKTAGLTHGGFYKQFASKEALIDEATAHAFNELTRHHEDEFEQHGGQRGAAQRALIEAYLSPDTATTRRTGVPSPHSSPTWRAKTKARKPAGSTPKAWATSPSGSPLRTRTASPGCAPCSAHSSWPGPPTAPRSPRRSSPPRARH